MEAERRERLKALLVEFREVKELYFAVGLALDKATNKLDEEVRK
jgi:hypothetical protein